MVQKHARTTWGNLDPWATNLPPTLNVRAIDPATHAAQRPVFYRRARSTMIAKRIKATLDKASMKSLNLEKAKFQWKEANGAIQNDGPTMLFIILTKVNPSVRVGISSLKSNLMTATMPKFQHNVIKMLDYMSAQMVKIREQQGSHDDYTLNLFNALSTTNNDEFKAFLNTEKNEWETSTSNQPDNVIADLLIEKVKLKYNNMMQSNSWKKSEDPSAKVISALVTQVKNLEDKLNMSGTNSAHATSSTNPQLRIPVWRTQKIGDKIDKDGKTWWWCPHHKKEGLFDGLYMTHKPSEHDNWAKNKKENWAKKKKADSSSDSKTLTLSDGLKQALMTEANLSAEQAEACWARVSGN